MNVTVKIEGLEKLRAALQEAGPKLAKKSVRKALSEGADIFVQDAKSRAPVLKEGTPQRKPGELRDSIDKSIRISTKEDRGVAHVGPRREKGGGNQQPGVYGMFVEFGSVHNPQPHPFMRAAFDGERERVTDSFVKTLREGLEVLRKK